MVENHIQRSRDTAEKTYFLLNYKANVITVAQINSIKASAKVKYTICKLKEYFLKETFNIY